MAEGVARLALRGSRSVCTCQHHVPWNVVLTSASTYSTFFTEPILVSRTTTWAVKYPYNKRANLKIDDDFESLMEVDDDKINDTDLLRSTIERNVAFWKWAFLQQVKRALVLPTQTVKTRGGPSSQTLDLPSHAVKTGRGRPETTCHICPLHV